VEQVLLVAVHQELQAQLIQVVVVVELITPVAIQVQEAVASSSFATQTHMTLLAQQLAHQPLP
jgi:hypothetical protein